jgi:hypothetical protein
MSLETDALDSAATAATNQTVAANNLKNAIDLLVTAYASTKSIVDNNLNNVNNTTDANKELSLASIAALLQKQAILVSGDNISTVNGLSLLSGDALVIARGQVEIPMLSYDNRADLRTPVLPEPLTGDVVNIPGLGLFQYSETFDYREDDETVFEAVSQSDGITPIGQWVMSVPSYEFSKIQDMFEMAVLDEFIEDQLEEHKEHGHDHYNL